MINIIPGTTRVRHIPDVERYLRTRGIGTIMDVPHQTRDGLRVTVRWANGDIRTPLVSILIEEVAA